MPAEPKLAHVEFDACPDDSSVELHFLEVPLEEIEEQAYQVHARARVPPLNRLMALLLQCPEESLVWSRPRWHVGRYENRPGKGHVGISRSLHIPAISGPWQSFHGIIYLRDSDRVGRSLARDYVDLYVRPSNTYAGIEPTPPDRSSEGEQALQDLRPRLQELVQEFLRLDTGEGDVCLHLADPIWGEDVMPVNGGDAYWFRGILVDPESSASK